MMETIRILFQFCLLLIYACVNIGSQSEYIYYWGKIEIEGIDTIPTDINIYPANLNFDILNSDGNLKHPESIPFHPDRNGYFVIALTTRSHGPNDNVEHWECGPLRLYIVKNNFVSYYDSLTNTELKELISDFRHAVRN